MRHLDRLEPFGERNEKPVLTSPSLRLAEPPRVVGATGAHLTFRVRAGDACLKAVAFGMGARREELRMGRDLRLVYTPRWNTFRGETSLELHVVDFEAEG
jgi:single-stranded-DNA-specific exonuclease